MEFIDRKMYTCSLTGEIFIYDIDTDRLYNKPNKEISQANPDYFELTYSRSRKIGERVKIKTVEQMLQYYNTGKYGSIDVPSRFTDTMEKYCGKVLKVVELVERNYHETRYRLEYDGEYLKDFIFSDEMLMSPNFIRRF